MKRAYGILTCAMLALSSIYARAQTTSYAQFWNEVDLTRPIAAKWTGELNIGDTWSSSPNAKRGFFDYNSQLYVRGWAHYYYSARWKFSGALAYYYNHDVPEINQTGLPEVRLSVQGMYFLHKTGYTVTSRSRVEDRFIKGSDGDFESVFRFREQMKLVYPINSKIIRKGVFYGIASDEIFLKTKSDITGSNIFDRNRFTGGLGYAFTDNFQMELTYVNEFLPRDKGNEVVNAIQLTLTFNNLLPNIEKEVKNLFHDFTESAGGE